MQRDNQISVSYFGRPSTTAAALTPDAQQLYTTTLDLNSSSNDAQVHTFFTFRSNKANRWSSSKPELTIPNKADSVELILARRASGLTEQVSPLNTIAYYPTDPEQAHQASEFYKTIVADRTSELEQIKEQINVEAQNSKKAAKAAEQEAEQYAKFKAEQNQNQK